MRVLVTGHLGYLGTVMTRVLRDAGHDVVGLDTGLFADRVLGPAPLDPPGLDVDLRDVTPDHLAGFEAVVHLAALSNDPLGSLAPQITYDINHEASVRLARAAKQAGVRRFLYASTCSVYGAAGEILVDESADLHPVTPYAVSKVRVEEDLHALADASFEPVYLRNATAFGFSPRLRADIVLNNLVGSAVLTGRVTVLSDGTPWRPLVHAEDIATAFEAALTAPREAVHDRAFNVGHEKNNVTVAQIAEHVAAAVPGSVLDITGEHGGDPRSYRVDFAAIRSALPHWECRWDIAAGAAELAAAYDELGLTAHAFGHDHVRLHVLTERQRAGQIDAAMRPLVSLV
ncbi:SDR family oxidoreductase [Nocardioides mangrovicus]|uniref:SDR family oxidoreductase n=1 Tax=Nocardioides mangrovicus TaxID=2478913 RepID=A0A3L8P2G2_9ACTN|nr:SDR family oxidoreductase [Nocardioides mangrovicus]RLV48618.1 SDR family oxidoreductase [Nocardioides mangrovicus]